MDERRRSQIAAPVAPRERGSARRLEQLAAILGGRPLAILGQHTGPGRLPGAPDQGRDRRPPAYRSIGEVPGPVDLAVFLVPPPVVPELLDQCGAAGVTTSYIITSGFGEAPEGDGRRLDTALRQACTRWPAMGVAGPNGEGVFDVAGDFALSFSPTVDYERGLRAPPVAGTIAVVAQSGASDPASSTRARPGGLRFSKIVSTGNEVDLEALDYVEYLLEDPATSVIALFIEGFKDPRRLRRVAGQALAVGKPLVVMKIGRSLQAQRTAVSHTAPPDRPERPLQRLVRRPRHHRGAEHGRAAGRGRGPGHHRLAVRPAGRGVHRIGRGWLWVVDACAEHGLDAPELPAEEQAGILAQLPYYASASTRSTTPPGPTTSRGYRRPGRAGRLELGRRGGAGQSLTVAEGLADRVRPLVELAPRPASPVVQSYTHPVPDAVSVLADLGIPWFVNQQGLGRTLAALADRHEAEQRWSARPNGGEPGPVPVGLGPERVVPEHVVKAWLRAAGLPVPEGWLVGDEAGAQAAGAELGYPVVVKLQSADISHKSDIGAVVVGVSGPEELSRAYHQVTAASSGPADGVLVERMAPAGPEMMIGAIGDPDLGPFVIVGAGGADAELAADTQILAAPATVGAARAAIDRLRMARSLSGWRGQPPADVAALAELVSRVSAWVVALDDDVVELDLNPVILHEVGRGVDIVDGLAVVRSPGASE